MPTTSAWSLTYPTSASAVNVPGDIQTLATNADTALTTVWKPPGCILYRTAAQSIPNSAFTDITFPTEEFDNASMCVAGGSTITIPTTVPSGAVWDVKFSGMYIANATGTRVLILLVNGVEFVAAGTEVIPTGAANSRMSASVSIKLNQGDILKVNGYQSSGGALNLSTARFSCVRQTA